MNRVPKGIYTKEFREQAVRLVVVDGLTQREAASRLSEPPRKCRRLRILAVTGDLKHGKRRQDKEAHRHAIFG